MKKIIIAILVSFLFFSCGDDDDTCKNSCKIVSEKMCSENNSGIETCTIISKTCNTWIKTVCKNNSCAIDKDKKVYCKEK